MELRLNIMATDTVTGFRIDTEMSDSFFRLGLSVNQEMYCKQTLGRVVRKTLEKIFRGVMSILQRSELRR